MHFDRYVCQIWRDEWALLPSITVRINSPVYHERNFAIFIHFLCVHMYWFWIEEE